VAGNPSEENLNIATTGLEALDRELLAIAAEDGAKSINGTMRKACREAVKQIVLPEVLAWIPSDSGFLESQIVVRAIKRSRGKIGFFVGFTEPLFQGDTFYGGFIEFGFTGRGGVQVEADSFLRRALYGNAERVIDHVRQRMKAYIAERNRAA
jgi:hypothetical protein